jgi:hypothetical protein
MNIKDMTDTEVWAERGKTTALLVKYQQWLGIIDAELAKRTQADTEEAE